MSNILEEWKNLMGKIDTSYRKVAVLNETKTLLTESQESKSIDAAKKLVMQRLNWDNARADQFVRNELRHDLPALRSKEGGKFILGCTRMFVDQELNDAMTMSKLNTALMHAVTPGFYEKFDRNLNNLHVNDFLSQMQPTVDAASRKMKDEVNAQQYNNNGENDGDYEIIAINSFEEAQQYSQYTSWCVTHAVYNYESYTKNGYNQFYFCLKHGFEDVQKVKGEGCPLDEYGLSMIAVSVDPEGELVTCTCRWNHDNGGNDNIMNPRQISDVLGVNFYDTFKPNDSFQKIADMLSGIERQLQAGTAPDQFFFGIRDVGEGLRRVILTRQSSGGGSNQNLLTKDNTFVFKNLLFDDIRVFHDGVVAVQNTNSKWNYATPDGHFISDAWFEKVGDFQEGFGIVTRSEPQDQDDFDEYYGGTENFIGKNGQILMADWMDEVYPFVNGFAQVYSEDNQGYNFVDKNGNFLYSGDNEYYESEWLSSTEDFRCGWAAIEDNNGNANFINGDGDLMFDPDDTVPTRTRSFEQYQSVKIPLAKVEFSNLGWNYVMTNGQLIYNNEPFFKSIKQDFDNNNGLAIVELANGTFNFLRPDGTFISRQNFDQYTGFFGKDHTGIAFVKIGDKLNVINRNGQILYPNLWFDKIASKWTPDPNNPDSLGIHEFVTQVNGQWYAFDKQTGEMIPTDAPKPRNF